jgi:UDP-2,4-diacetamido-2,4,6-trideoxy-beta-L-altropyranose hydrolase
LDFIFKKNINKTELNSYIYTPLRKEFWSKSKFKVKKKIKKILVFFGGGDIHNLSDRFIKIMPELYKNYHLTVISKKKKKIKNVKFLKFMKAKELKKNILNCDLVITSGGQTLYELACIGCPALVVSDTKYDIEDINAWKKKGTIIYLGKWNRIKFNDNFKKKFKKIKFYSVRKKFSENGRELIDGKGALRLAKKIIENVKYNFKK